MYDVLLAVKSRMLVQELNRLHIWGDSTGFYIRETTSDFEHIVEKLKETKYQLVLLENLPDNHMLSLLRTIKKENLCRAVAVVSETCEFQTVRKSFLLGAEDFLVAPLELGQFIALFSKIESEEHIKTAARLDRKDEMLHFFEQADFSIREWLDELFVRILAEYGVGEEARSHLNSLLEEVVRSLSDRHGWLEYYFTVNDFLPVGEQNVGYEGGMKKALDDFYSLFVAFSELYPPHRAEMDRILLYILNRPEGDLKQITISEELYMNRSYLSTVFSAQMGVNFVDYVNMVKMRRAAYLLRHTEMKIIDIADLLDYKDMGHFLKRFKAQYRMTPSQYRIPETYEFQI